MNTRVILAALGVGTLATFARAEEPIAISADGRSFVLAESRRPFVPWGFNYDRDYKFRLIEEYWDKEWDTVAADFREMKRLGANTIRVHLQFGRFMDAPDRPNAAALERLEKLVTLAEQTGLYLDLTGLGCYRLKDQPAWYAETIEPDRWAAQAAFWAAIAKRCAGRPAVLAFDLVNEPAVGNKQPAGQWVHPADLAGFHYVQFIALDAAGRDAAKLWQQWAHTLTAAIRRQDPHRLVTVGLLPLPNQAMIKGVAAEVDYLSVHLYPKSGQLNQQLATLKHYAVGKPLIIEEMYPVECSADEMVDFIHRSQPAACGWISFYWGKPLAELKKSKEFGERLQVAWLEKFQQLAPAITTPPSAAPGDKH